MSNYTKNTNFSAKDALTDGDPSKIILGSLFDSEYDEIATAIASKEDSANKNTASGYVGLTSSTLISPTYLPAATSSAIGAAELATTTEANTGTDTGRVVTPEGLKYAIDNYASGLFPTKAGTGATGTWGISISGNAATATSASSASAVPWSGISSTPTTRAGYGITDVPKTDGTSATGTWGIAISGNAATASSCSGNAATATVLATARNINGVSFNGSANITVTAAADTLTGTTLAALSGANLTALNGTQVTSGTVAKARIDADVYRGTLGSANISAQSGGSPSGGSNGDIILIY